MEGDIRVAIMLDTKGPEIRTGKLKENTEGKKLHKLVAGQEILVSADSSILGDSNIITLDYKELCSSVEVLLFSLTQGWWFYPYCRWTNCAHY